MTARSRRIATTKPLRRSPCVSPLLLLLSSLPSYFPLYFFRRRGVRFRFLAFSFLASPPSFFPSARRTLHSFRLLVVPRLFSSLFSPLPLAAFSRRRARRTRKNERPSRRQGAFVQSVRRSISAAFRDRRRIRPSRGLRRAGATTTSRRPRTEPNKRRRSRRNPTAPADPSRSPFPY